MEIKELNNSEEVDPAEKLLHAGSEEPGRPKPSINNLLGIGGGLFLLLALIVFNPTKTNNEVDPFLANVSEKNQTQTPLTQTEGINVDSDKVTTSRQNEYLSKWKVFTESEARDFWSYQLGEWFNQEDIFVKLLFPSISDEVKIFSIPYFQLLLWPTTEWFEQEEEALNQDLFQAGDRSNWVSCSNVVIVFPNSKYDEIEELNDVFCD